MTVPAVPAARLILLALPAPVLLLLLLLVPLAAGAQVEGPTTEFEDAGGAAWTSLEGEQTFLTAVEEASDRVEVTEVGRSVEDRPIQLVRIGHPAPPPLPGALDRPTMFLTCSVHGNEPAGREACLITLRDLALSEDPATIDLLSRTTVLVTPTANPDGRAANSRGNADGVDVNRDHLNLRTPESRAIAAVIRDHQPDLVMDMHEYGPSQPVVYDDDVLVLWPRNVNVDEDVHDLSMELAQDHLIAGVEAEGYSADEYGVASAGDIDLTQTAGDEDEGILRNMVGLRHGLGILVESATSPSLTDPTEQLDSAMSRRVASQVATIDQALAFMDTRGAEAMAASDASRTAKAAEGRDRSAPLYVGGQRQDSTIDGSGPPPTAEETIDPPPCGYLLTPEQHDEVAEAFELHGITTVPGPDGSVEVPLAQVAEPVIGLLLDERAVRNAFTGTDTTWAGEGVPQVLDVCQPLAMRTIRRIAESTVPGTAAAAAEVAVVEAATVVLATTADYADALGGTVLARQLGAPLLLSDPAGLSDPVRDEVVRRGVGEAVLLGGVDALSSQVAEDLAELGVEVRRLAGADRFETAGLVLDELGRSGGGAVDRVSVVEGEHADPARGWPDAVSAAALGDPILLVNAARLPAETAARLDGVDVRVIGGTAAVSEAVAEEVEELAGSVTRVAGPTRYATSRVVAETAPAPVGEGLPEVWLASGRHWPEALIAAASGSPFLLIDGLDPDGSPETTAYLTETAEAFGTVTLVGPEAAITAEVEEALRILLGG